MDLIRAYKDVAEKIVAPYRGKKVALAWSGGYDSTMLLLLLAEYGIDVTAVAFDSGNLPNNIEQKRARRVIWETLKVYDNVKYIERTVNVPDPAPGFAYPQLAMWVLYSAAAVEKAYDYFLTAHVLGDAAPAYIDEIRGVFRSLKPLLQKWFEMWEYDQPLAKTEKITVLEMMLYHESYRPSRYTEALTTSLLSVYVCNDLEANYGRGAGCRCESCNGHYNNLMLKGIGASASVEDTLVFFHRLGHHAVIKPTWRKWLAARPGVGSVRVRDKDITINLGGHDVIVDYDKVSHLVNDSEEGFDLEREGLRLPKIGVLTTPVTMVEDE